MEKCVSCGTKKGKRNCPSMGAKICSQCCGARLETGDCVLDCHYFIEHINRIGQMQLEKSDLDFLLELDTATFDEAALSSVTDSIEEALTRVRSERGYVSNSDVYDALEYLYEIGRVKLHLRSDLEESLSGMARIIADAIEESLGWAALVHRNDIMLSMKCFVSIGTHLDDRDEEYMPNPRKPGASRQDDSGQGKRVYRSSYFHGIF